MDSPDVIAPAAWYEEHFPAEAVMRMLVPSWAAAVGGAELVATRELVVRGWRRERDDAAEGGWVLATYMRRYDGATDAAALAIHVAAACRAGGTQRPASLYSDAGHMVATPLCRRASAVLARAGARTCDEEEMSSAARAAFTASAAWRELTFDLDFNDYDTEMAAPLRACACVGSKRVCRDCWPLVAVATRLLVLFVREVLGFCDIHVQFSGRRGTHVFVADAEACALDADERAAVYEAAHLWDGGGVSASARVGDAARELDAYVRAEVLPRHPAIARRYDEAAPAGAGAPSGRALLRRAAAAVGVILDADITKALRRAMRLPGSLHSGTGDVCLPLPTSLRGLADFDPAADARPTAATAARLRRWAATVLAPRD